MVAVLTMAAHAQLSLLPGDATLAPVAGDQAAPAIARGGNLLLAVWSDTRANVTGGYEGETSRDIYGVRLDLAGNVLDPLPVARGDINGDSDADFADRNRFLAHCYSNAAWTGPGL